MKAAEPNCSFSPGLDPIERAYSTLKAYLRKIAAPTVARLMRGVETCARTFLPVECCNYVTACVNDTD